MNRRQMLRGGLFGLAAIPFWKLLSFGSEREPIKVTYKVTYEGKTVNICQGNAKSKKLIDDKGFVCIETVGWVSACDPSNPNLQQAMKCLFQFQTQLKQGYRRMEMRSRLTADGRRLNWRTLDREATKT